VSAETFNDALEQFFRAMRTARMKAPSLDGGLTFPQYVLLLPLIDGEACGVRVLAEAAGVASPTATRTLDGLERDGMVSRRPSETDRRSVVVELTAEGRGVMEAARDSQRAARSALYERLDASEQAEAEAMMRRLTEIIRLP
jgi:MarR family transcriptional regulator, organic hydroperoxide resistance regulator